MVFSFYCQKRQIDDDDDESSIRSTQWRLRKSYCTSKIMFRAFWVKWGTRRTKTWSTTWRNRLEVLVNRLSNTSVRTSTQCGSSTKTNIRSAEMYTWHCEYGWHLWEMAILVFFSQLNIKWIARCLFHVLTIISCKWIVSSLAGCILNFLPASSIIKSQIKYC